MKKEGRPGRMEEILISSCWKLAESTLGMLRGTLLGSDETWSVLCKLPQSRPENGGSIFV
jgi:hypothetical protein